MTTHSNCDDKPLWPITLIRLVSDEDAQQWLPALRRFAPFALPWLAKTGEEAITTLQWVENVLSWVPNVWLGVDNVNPNTAAIWLVGGLDDVIPHKSASIHGMAHPILNARVNTKASKTHPVNPWAKSWMAKALCSAAFEEYRCHSLTATIPPTHAGARGFCLNYGFQAQPCPSKNNVEKTYQLTAPRYYAHPSFRRNPHVLR